MRNLGVLSLAQNRTSFFQRALDKRAAYVAFGQPTTMRGRRKQMHAFFEGTQWSAQVTVQMQRAKVGRTFARRAEKHSLPYYLPPYGEEAEEAADRGIARVWWWWQHRKGTDTCYRKSKFFIFPHWLVSQSEKINTWQHAILVGTQLLSHPDP